MEATMTTPKKKDPEPKKEFKPYIIKGIDVQEILDESGQVNESTIVKLKADDGIIWNLSVGAAYRLERDLRDTLGL
jgi:outer membrane protein W